MEVAQLPMAISSFNDWACPDLPKEIEKKIIAVIEMFFICPAKWLCKMKLG